MGRALQNWDASQLSLNAWRELLAESLPAGATPFFTSLDKVKFKHPVLPGDTLETECVITKSKGPFYFASGKGFVKGKLCVSGDFSFAVIRK